MARSQAPPSLAGASAQAQWRRARAARSALRVGSGLSAVGLAVAAIVQRDALLLLAVAVAVLGAWWWPRDDMDRWRRGAEGEAATAAVLERLPRRWVVLHDRAVPGSLANIDHLVIGPTGVWLVDTKAVRARLRIGQGQVWAGDHPIATGPAAWEAEVVSERLAVGAAPIVAVHGEGLRRRGKISAGVRVVPARRLVSKLRRGRRLLSRDEVATLAARADQVFPPRSTRSGRPGPG